VPRLSFGSRSPSDCKTPLVLVWICASTQGVRPKRRGRPWALFLPTFRGQQPEAPKARWPQTRRSPQTIQRVMCPVSTGGRSRRCSCRAREILAFASLSEMADGVGRERLGLSKQVRPQTASGSVGENGGGVGQPSPTLPLVNAATSRAGLEGAAMYPSGTCRGGDTRPRRWGTDRATPRR